MSLRPRFLSTLVALLAFAGVTSQVASCGLETAGTQEPEAATPCTTDANCEDGNPCTIDTCQTDNTCARSNAENGPLKDQVAGDCRRNDCLDGEVVQTNDDADTEDDKEPCTTDSCNAGTPVHPPLANDTMCTVGVSPGKCVMGVCSVECSPTKPCDDNNPCTEDSCNASLGTCTYVKLDGLPTPGFTEPVGDCKIHICSAGVDDPLNDDADTADDNNSCTFDVCMNGVGSHPGVSMGTPCMVGQPEVCNGQGTCVECNVPADCVNLPTNDDCQTRTCVNNKCGQDFTASGTPISNQKAGDCKEVQCDGTGKTMTVNSAVDVPEDNNPCTENICTNGMPSNPNIAAGVSCGNPLICDGSGKCIGCITPADCVDLPPNDFCKTRTCINQTCGLSLTPAGTDTPDNQTAENCKVFECDAMGNIVESVDPNDKPVDDNQCTKDLCSGLGDPSNPPEPVNAACMQMGGTVCNGAGVCKVNNGDACAAAGDCLSGFCVDGVCCDAACGNSCKSCNVPGNVGKCVNVPKGIEDLPGCSGTNSCDGAGTCKKDDAQGCGAPAECVSNFCIDGVCCAAACTAACNACNIMGSLGICTPLTAGEDNVPANVCNGNKGCDPFGACKSDNGQPCTSGGECVSGQCFDGVCCNAVCSGTCKSCNIAGAVGICSNVAAGLDDTNGVPACSGVNQSCDGNGVCKKENGQTCTATTDCLSGICVDGVCCNAACTGTCVSCAIAGSLGICTNTANGQDDVGTCSGTNLSCDGMGACKSEIGNACSSNAGCLSGFCVDGFCCNTACGGNDATDCQACSVAAGAGTNGICSPLAMGTTCRAQNGVCDVAETCNGSAVACPADGVAQTTTICRAKNGACDVADNCDGTAKTCPATDAVEPNTTVCRAKNGACDVADHCDGMAKTCPATDAVEPNTTVCRAKTGDCDIAETCDGTTKDCPATDAVEPNTTVCRPAIAGGCDVQEKCDGTLKTCPTDIVVAGGTECRAATDLCDQAETCTGSSPSCPANSLKGAGSTCRPAVGDCDIAETCNGMSAACPADAVSPLNTVCHSSMGACDVAEVCDGMSNACPMDVLVAMGTVCRAAVTGGCDIEETCTGAAPTCPNDAVQPAGTVCRAADDLCDLAEVCNGTPSCPPDVFKSAGSVCRPAVGICDVAEQCAGGTPVCPADAFEPMGTNCGDVQSCTGETQTNADVCDGTGMCLEGGTTSCGPYVCDTTSCFMNCTTNAQCSGTNICTGMVCGP